MIADVPETFRQWPWLVVLFGVLYALRAALELAGMASKNLTGISRLLSARRRAEAASDRRVVELTDTLAIVDGQVDRLLQQVAGLEARVATADQHLAIAHRLSDAQGRAINAHLAWDRRLITSVRQALPDFEFPDPPELYVFIEEAP